MYYVLVIHTATYYTFRYTGKLRVLFYYVYTLPVPSSEQGRGGQFVLGEVYHLLLPSREGVKVEIIYTMFLYTLLSFTKLTTLLPILFFLLSSKESGSTTLLFYLITVIFVLIGGTLTTKLSHFRGRFLVSLCHQLDFSLFASCCRQKLLFVHDEKDVQLKCRIGCVYCTFSLGLLSPLLHVAKRLLLIF